MRAYLVLCWLWCEGGGPWHKSTKIIPVLKIQISWWILYSPIHPFTSIHIHSSIHHWIKIELLSTLAAPSSSLMHWTLPTPLPSEQMQTMRHRRSVHIHQGTVQVDLFLPSLLSFLLLLSLFFFLSLIFWISPICNFVGLAKVSSGRRGRDIKNWFSSPLESSRSPLHKREKEKRGKKKKKG